ncbi:MAG: transcriptional regulator [Gimesia sp.]|uniref:helix-turn-helix domain-containing protein n=1 Tax=Gimesia sp. TaxID=2024833 RepID=UPI000C36D0D3|nr:helix-turn-helix transcriptional regulator [Gimesia sp.]MAX38809.1 transcriptional regulator [Gimesia sp.]
MTTFGKRLRELRKERDLSQKALAEKVAINFTYLSKIETERLDFAQFPSEELICKLASVLDTDKDELLILAKKIPAKIKERVFERPEVFAALADCDDKTLDSLISQIGKPHRKKLKTV